MGPDEGLILCNCAVRTKVNLTCDDVIEKSQLLASRTETMPVLAGGELHNIIVELIEVDGTCLIPKMQTA